MHHITWKREVIPPKLSELSSGQLIKVDRLGGRTGHPPKIHSIQYQNLRVMASFFRYSDTPVLGVGDTWNVDRPYSFDD